MTKPGATGTNRLVSARGAAWTATVVACLVLALMAWWLHDTRDPTGLDDTVARWLLDTTGTTVQQAMLGLSDPLLTVGGCGVVAICALLVRRWQLAALAVIGPLAGLLLESHVLKPAIDRRYGLVETLSHGAVKAGYAFPSGHQTGATSLTMLLAILLLGSTAARRVKVGLSAVLVLWTAVAALGLVRSAYHYFTDTIGGIALGVGVMLTTALLIDVVSSRVSSPGGRVRTRTARAV